MLVTFVDVTCTIKGGFKKEFLAMGIINSYVMHQIIKMGKIRKQKESRKNKSIEKLHGRGREKKFNKQVVRTLTNNT